MKHTKNKITPIGKHHAFVIMSCPETGKDIYNFIEYPVSPYQDKGSYLVIANDYTFEGAMKKTIEVLGDKAVIAETVLSKLNEIVENLNRYSGVESNSRVKISRQFLEKEMEIPKDQLDIYGETFTWNVVYESDGKLNFGAE